MKKSLRQLAVLLAIAASAFSLAYLVQRSRAKSTPQTTAAVRAKTPDSVLLSGYGIKPGRQLIAYILLSSHCGQCQRADTKAAVGSVRNLLRTNMARDFRSTTTVGVLIEGDLTEGFDYLNSIGHKNFDEISIGNAWLNEHLVKLVWRDKTTVAAVPQVVLVARDMSATLRPFNVTYGRDSVIAVLFGRDEVIEWVRRGGSSISAEAVAGPENKRDTTLATVTTSR